ncbi:helix-turn-helix transcriptional regulator [Luteolibacter sp. SL250]|uniref:helix-turn-helix transcriptional regulator n=1 Tax=Luteolibacter sp. SL250 TaxID=2995170 RepID=UPI00226F9EED|nr:helix-turn-helix transcriptional regulator [Luteolibacter sp. SL250]WAC20925.1 helix-turn-helix transcriptional regulator [Luteolibacter sp. SL250]
MRDEPITTSTDVLLAEMDVRIQKENRRLLTNLIAWAEIFDALGWNVALALPGRVALLNARAERWASGKHPASAMDWDDITARLEASPPARRLAGTARVHIWADGPCPAEPQPAQPFTRREAEVLDWLREGKTGPEIAIILGCGQRTVESHVLRIYRKLGVSKRADLMFQSGKETL